MCCTNQRLGNLKQGVACHAHTEKDFSKSGRESYTFMQTIILPKYENRVTDKNRNICNSTLEKMGLFFCNTLYYKSPLEDEVLYR